MNPLEQKIYYPLAKLRTVAFRPFSALFTAVGISADMLSYLGVLLMITFIFTVTNHPRAAFWLLFGRMVADIMDGPLARYQKTDSDRGKFVDVLADVSGFALFVVGLSYSGQLRGVWATLFIFLSLLVVVLMVISNNLEHKSKDWFFFSSAGSYPHILIYASYLVFGWYAFGHSNYLNGAAHLFCALLAGKAVAEFWAIQKTKKN